MCAFLSRMIHCFPMEAMHRLSPCFTKSATVWLAVSLLLAVPVAWTQEKAEVAPAAAKKEVKKGDADPADASAAAEVPKVEKIDEHRYRMGLIEFNGKTREIRVPALVNMREGILEFVLVHGTGKIHESLLVTEVSPTQVQVVMKLCRYRDGEGDTFDVFFPDEEKKGEAGAKERGEDVDLTVEWEVDGEHKAVAVSEWIFDRKRDAAMKNDPWVYSGSYMLDEDFMADLDGTLVAIYLTRGAMLNTMTDGADDDERWLAHGDNTPEIGTKVTFVLSPAESAEKKTAAAPK